MIQKRPERALLYPWLKQVSKYHTGTVCKKWSVVVLCQNGALGTVSWACLKEKAVKICLYRRATEILQVDKEYGIAR